jgi:NAD(P)-dependent dehydrogenase (short-subunit alcohol dehydrogenase family)
MRRLAGKAAFITGGAGGIGSATAERFIAEGAQVTIADLNADAARRVAESLGPQAHAVTIDIGDEVSVKAAPRDGIGPHDGIPSEPMQAVRKRP